ncbi:MAG: YncE family protein [Bacteroidetes bacterium]|nr:YncE family protein [Bacteroidota bacterium]
MKTLKFLLIITAFCTLHLAQAQKSEYKVLKNIPLEGDGGWDYLLADDATQRLYVSHGIMVQVLDIKTEKLIGTIPGTPGVHGIAIVKEFGKGFITAGRLDSVVVFDLKTLKPTAKIKTDKNPDAILYDTFSKRIFTFNGRGSSVTAIDAKTNKVLGTLPVSGKPEAAVSDGKGKIFVNIEDKSNITKFDAKTLKIEAEWPLDPGKEPSGLAIDLKTNRLFSACGESKTVLVMDALSGKLIASLPMGEGCDGIVFIKEDQNALASCGDGVLTVVHQVSPSEYTVIQTLPTRRSARTITYSKAEKKIYMSSADVTMENNRRKVAPGSFQILVVGK